MNWPTINSAEAQEKVALDQECSSSGGSNSNSKGSSLEPQPLQSQSQRLPASSQQTPHQPLPSQIPTLAPSSMTSRSNDKMTSGGASSSSAATNDRRFNRMANSNPYSRPPASRDPPLLHVRVSDRNAAGGLSGPSSIGGSGGASNSGSDNLSDAARKILQSMSSPLEEAKKIPLNESEGQTDASLTCNRPATDISTSFLNRSSTAVPAAAVARDQSSSHRINWSIMNSKDIADRTRNTTLSLPASLTQRQSTLAPYSMATRSPFYAGKTTFGGSSARRAYRLANSNPYSRAVRAAPPVLHVRVTDRTSSGSAGLNNSSSMSNSDNLSDAARKILQSMSSPLQEAKKIPLNQSQGLSNRIVYQTYNRPTASTFGISTSSLNRSTTTTTTHVLPVARDQSLRTNWPIDLKDYVDKDKQESNVADVRDSSNSSRSAFPKTTTTAIPSYVQSNVPSVNYLASDDHNSNVPSAGGGKMRSSMASSTRTAMRQEVESNETLESLSSHAAVELPKVSLPALKSLPTFNFGKSTTTNFGAGLTGSSESVNEGKKSSTCTNPDAASKRSAYGLANDIFSTSTTKTTSPSQLSSSIPKKNVPDVDAVSQQKQKQQQQQQQQQTTTWTCGTCMLINTKDKERCPACEEPQPGFRKSGSSSSSLPVPSTPLFTFGVPPSSKAAVVPSVAPSQTTCRTSFTTTATMTSTTSSLPSSSWTQPSSTITTSSSTASSSPAHTPFSLPSDFTSSLTPSSSTSSSTAAAGTGGGKMKSSLSSARMSMREGKESNETPESLSHASQLPNAASLPLLKGLPTFDFAAKSSNSNSDGGVNQSVFLKSSSSSSSSSPTQVNGGVPDKLITGGEKVFANENSVGFMGFNNNNNNDKSIANNNVPTFNFSSSSSNNSTTGSENHLKQLHDLSNETSKNKTTSSSVFLTSSSPKFGSSPVFNEFPFSSPAPLSAVTRSSRTITTAVTESSSSYSSPPPSSSKSSFAPSSPPKKNVPVMVEKDEVFTASPVASSITATAVVVEPSTVAKSLPGFKFGGSNVFASTTTAAAAVTTTPTSTPASAPLTNASASASISSPFGGYSLQQQPQHQSSKRSFTSGNTDVSMGGTEMEFQASTRVQEQNCQSSSSSSQSASIATPSSLVAPTAVVPSVFKFGSSSLSSSSPAPSSAGAPAPVFGASSIGTTSPFSFGSRIASASAPAAATAPVNSTPIASSSSSSVGVFKFGGTPLNPSAPHAVPAPAFGITSPFGAGTTAASPFGQSNLFKPMNPDVPMMSGGADMEFQAQHITPLQPLMPTASNLSNLSMPSIFNFAPNASSTPNSNSATPQQSASGAAEDRSLRKFAKAKRRITKTSK